MAGEEYSGVGCEEEEGKGEEGTDGGEESRNSSGRVREEGEKLQQQQQLKEEQQQGDGASLSADQRHEGGEVGTEGKREGGDEEEDLAADATLSKMKLSTNFGAPLRGAGAGGSGSGDEGGEKEGGRNGCGGLNTPSTPSGSGTGSISGAGVGGEEGRGAAFSPTPATPLSRRSDVTTMDSAALSSLINSTTAAGADENNLVELARIHEKIVDLEAKAGKV